MTTRVSCLLVICLCYFSVGSNAQETMREKAKLKGMVSSVTTSNGNDFIKEHYNKSGQLIWKQTKYKMFEHHIYNPKGLLTSYEVRVFSSGHIDSYELEYDENGFLISDGYIDYKNDEQGNCIEETRNFGKIRRKYNDKNQIVEEWTYYGENNIRHSWGEDENGNYWEKDEVMPSESEHVLFTYNEYGDVIRLQTTNTETQKIDDITYQYDEKGNWIEQHHSAYITTDPVGSYDKVTGNLITRTIEYYK